MSYLVDSFSLVSCQTALLINSIFLQKKSDFIARVQEVIITDMIIISGSEFSLLIRALMRYDLVYIATNAVNSLQRSE